MVRILITGGAGFVGAHLARACLARGDEVSVLARPSTNIWRLHAIADRIRVHRTQLTDGATLARVFADAAPEIVFHLANATRLPERPDLSDVTQALEDDQRGLMTLLSAAATAETPPRTFVRAGTIAEYGRTPLPFREDAREEPLNAYGAVALSMTRLMNVLGPRLPFDTAVARLALIYGLWQSESFLIPRLIRACLEGRPVDIAHPDDRRDLIHIDDAVEGLVRLAGAPAPVVNIASGVAPTMREVATAVLDATGADPALIRLGTDRPTSAVPALHCDTSLAEGLLGWQADIALADGIARTVDAMRPDILQKGVSL